MFAGCWPPVINPGCYQRQDLQQQQKDKWGVDDFHGIYVAQVINFCIIILQIWSVPKITFCESGQVYCLKAILLPINCRKMELFPKGVATDQTAPRRPFPVQSQGISSHSLVALARTLEYFLPLKLWPSRLLLENKSCMSRFDFTYCSSGFVFAFGDFSFLWQLFMFQKISKAATLFRYFTFQWGHVITHSSRQEWHQRSHRLDHIIWQIWDVILIFIWSNQGALFSATFPCQISFLINNGCLSYNNLFAVDCCAFQWGYRMGGKMQEQESNLTSKVGSSFLYGGW